MSLCDGTEEGEVGCGGDGGAVAVSGGVAAMALR